MQPLTMQELAETIQQVLKQRQAQQQ
jgi:hypothetical protein